MLRPPRKDNKPRAPQDFITDGYMEYPVPKEGESFKRGHLPTKVMLAYERISGIWGVPFEQLAPVRWHMSKFSLDGGVYQYGLHVLDFRPKVGLMEHELGHSVAMLLNPDEKIGEIGPKQSLGFSLARVGRNLANTGKRLGEAFTKRTFAEAFANSMITADEKPLLITLQHGSILPAVAAYGLGYIGATSFLSLLAATYLGHKVRDHSVRAFCDKYGTDGFILLAVSNPHGLFKYSLKSDEKRYIEEGILQSPTPSRGGCLTPKGEDYLREKLPRDEILRRVEVMRKNREEIERRMANKS